MAVRRTVSGGAIQEGVLAFLEDKDSVRVLQDFAERNLLSIIGLMRGGIESAIKELSGRTSPSRLIVDVSRSKNVQRDVIHLADLCDTDTALVLIGSDEGIDLYRELIGLGVRDYLLKPLSIESLYNAFDLRSGTAKGESSGRRCWHIGRMWGIDHNGGLRLVFVGGEQTLYVCR